MDNRGQLRFDAFELSPVVAVAIGLDSDARPVILDANAAAREKFAGMTPAIVGRDADDLVHRRSLDDWSVLVKNADRDADGVEIRLAPESVGTDKPTAMVARASRLTTGDVVVQFIEMKASRFVEGVLEQQKRFRAALLELGSLGHEAEDDEDFYQRLLERAVEVVPGAQGGSVQLAVPRTTTFRFVAAVGYDLDGLKQHVLDKNHFFRDAENPAAEIVRELSVDTRSDEITEWLETVGRLSEIQSNVSAPVLVAGLPVAFLSLDNFEDSDAMNEMSVEMTTVLARLIGDLYVRRTLEAAVRDEREAYRHLAMHDPLTGLANRRHLERVLDDMLMTTGGRGRPAAVFFVDLDDFKAVNDRHGHGFGDRVLAAVAAGLNDAVRTGDLVGRWGGDEFIVLPNRLESPEEAIELGERILERFDKPIAFDSGDLHTAHVTVGIGWTLDSQVDGDTLVRAADEALYEAKAAGKRATRLRKV